jgi:beta-fructofuranosidase
MGDSMDGYFIEPDDCVLDGNNFIFYAAKNVSFDGKQYLCGWLGRAGLSVDSGMYQWAGNMLNHQLVQHEDGTLGVKAPDNFAQYFTEDKAFTAVEKEGTVEIDGSSIKLSAEAGSQALADMGMRAPTMMLECDVSFDEGGCVGFAFGGTENDPVYTALYLDAGRNLLHYEGYEITELNDYEPAAYTKFDFSAGGTHHVQLVCENEIVVMYVDDMKALSLRVNHSINGAHIGVFADGCSAEFSNITMKVPA